MMFYLKPMQHLKALKTHCNYTATLQEYYGIYFFQALSSNMASSNEEKESSALLLSSVLGKMAEAKVSMGDQESAQQDFLEATKLLL